MRAFVVSVTERDVDAASDVLWQLGVRAIEERQVGASAERSIELWTAVGDEPEAIARAAGALGGRWQHRIVDVAEEAAQTWRDHAGPMQVDADLVIVPAWQDVSVRAGVTAVHIEPGGAFGLGDHPTTQLSLRALRGLLDGQRGDAETGEMGEMGDVLDVGCGTGVIAVTAAMFQDRPVRAIDVASAAVEATIDNARRNGVGDRVHVDTTDLADIEGDYDVVVANILAPVLVSLAADLRRVTRPGGRLIVSGILAGSHQHVLDALAPMQVERTDELDGWAAVVLRHPSRRGESVDLVGEGE
jgi:ribosomal protein L11 methyltransferase